MERFGMFEYGGQDNWIEAAGIGAVWEFGDPDLEEVRSKFGSSLFGGGTPDLIPIPAEHDLVGQAPQEAPLGG